MNPIGISLLIFLSLLLGAIAGFFLRGMLPQHHLNDESKDIVKLGTGLIGTMAALLLGLLVASAKNSYDAERGEIVQMAAKVVFLDRLLAHYGPESQDARQLLRHALERTISRIWPRDARAPSQLDPSATSEGLHDVLARLSPKTDDQRDLKSQALQVISDIGQMRWLLAEQNESSISTPFLIVVVFWLTLIFVSFGLFAPPNWTVFVTLFLCSLSVAGAFFLVLELDQPFGGLIQISSLPLRGALEHLGR
jgi:hypothetical protein